MKRQETETHPLHEHRERLSEHLQKVQETGRPLFITEEGRTAGVLLSSQTYEDLIAKAELAENLAIIDEGLADVKAGRVQEGREAMREIAKQYGINFNR